MHRIFWLHLDSMCDIWSSSIIMCANDGWVALSFIEMNHKLLMKICKARSSKKKFEVSTCHKPCHKQQVIMLWAACLFRETLQLAKASGPQPTYMQEKDDHLPPPPPFQHSTPGLLTFRYYSKVFKLLSFSTHLGIFFTSIIHSHVCKFCACRQ